MKLIESQVLEVVWDMLKHVWSANAKIVSCDRKIYVFVAPLMNKSSKHAKDCVYVRERGIVCVWMCVRDNERERECVCVCFN